MRGMNAKQSDLKRELFGKASLEALGVRAPPHHHPRKG